VQRRRALPDLVRLQPDQLGGECREALLVASCPANVDGKVSTLNPSKSREFRAQSNVRSAHALDTTEDGQPVNLVGLLRLRGKRQHDGADACEQADAQYATPQHVSFLESETGDQCTLRPPPDGVKQMNWAGQSY